MEYKDMPEWIEKLISDWESDMTWEGWWYDAVIEDFLAYAQERGAVLVNTQSPSTSES